MLTQIKPIIIHQNGNQPIGSYKKNPLTMSMNLTDYADHYHLQVEFPGFLKNDLKLEIVEDKLFIVSKKTRKSVYIPRDVNKNQINSAIYDGVVCLRLPKF
jgi:HSP20 family molecular chaperone IbpA